MYILQLSINQTEEKERRRARAKAEKKEHSLPRPGTLLIFYRWQTMEHAHSLES